MNKICQDYINLINNKYASIVDTIIIYGSNIYDGNSHDLDVCLIVSECSNEIKELLIKDTILFHKLNNLKIDEEIPFTNKLIYTWKEIDDAINNSPYYVLDKAIIKDISKDEEFLASSEMKKRLILNILTTDHIAIGKEITYYEELAFKLMIKVIKEYYNLDNPNYLDLLQCMYVNQYTGSSGEMYLGYKRNKLEKEKYLIRQLKKYQND